MMVDYDYERLREILLANSDIDISYYSKSFVMRRVTLRMNIYHVKDYNEYIKILKNDKREVNELIKELSINVTEFFRDKDVFDHFATLLKCYSNANILSIGCATGEEPYSIALIARSNGVICNIVAYDINRNAINYAIQGCYNLKSIKNIPPHMLNTYFDTDGKNYYIKKEIKDMVRFEVKDITKIDTRHFKNVYDFIFCRNMLIYIDNSIKDTLISNICNAIKVGGYLIIGKSESILTSNNLECINIKTKIYRRVK